jgi:TatD DNase family protein
MWTDTHCHLDEDRYNGEGNKNLGGTVGVLENARAAKVSRFITVGCDAESSRAAIDCASRFDDVWASVGLHPHEAVHGVDTIVELITSPRVVAIGEAGLDYYYEHSARDEQKVAFAAQIQLAHQFQLPLIIHTRDAWDDTFDILRAEGTPEQTIFHCFTGGPDEARRCLDIGAFLSFSGIVTFKTAQDVAEAATLCPLDRILVEIADGKPGKSLVSALLRTKLKLSVSLRLTCSDQIRFAATFAGGEFKGRRLTVLTVVVPR